MFTKLKKMGLFLINNMQTLPPRLPPPPRSAQKWPILLLFFKCQPKQFSDNFFFCLKSSETYAKNIIKVRANRKAPRFVGGLPLGPGCFWIESP